MTENCANCKHRGATIINNEYAMTHFGYKEIEIFCKIVGLPYDADHVCKRWAEDKLEKGGAE